jgi:NADPH2:quinone reductase
MKAIVCRRHGPPETLALEELPSPIPGPTQVLIRVYAAGVNFPDTLVIRGSYQIKPDLPFTPGGEVAGVVIRVGREVKNVREGDRVLAAMAWGGFAEEALAEAWRVHVLPPEMDFVTAAGFTIAYATSYHALKDRARLQAGETMLVLGAAGGVGLAAIEIGKTMGARVIAAASSDEKLELCDKRGADHTIHYGRHDLRNRINEIAGEGGVDVVFDPVGGQFTNAALRSTAWKGRYLVVGFASGEIPSVPLNIPLLKGSSIMGVHWGAFCRNEPQNNSRNMDELFGLFIEQKVKPYIWSTFSLDRTGDAMTALLNRDARGKVVVEVRR